MCRLNEIIHVNRWAQCQPHGKCSIMEHFSYSPKLLEHWQYLWNRCPTWRWRWSTLRCVISGMFLNLYILIFYNHNTNKLCSQNVAFSWYYGLPTSCVSDPVEGFWYISSLIILQLPLRLPWLYSFFTWGQWSWAGVRSLSGYTARW